LALLLKLVARTYRPASAIATRRPNRHQRPSWSHPGALRATAGIVDANANRNQGGVTNYGWLFNLDRASS
jgi:hypothetical protein